MKKFVFQLDTALAFRRQQEESEKAKLEALASRRSALAVRRANLDKSLELSRLETSRMPSITAGELQALDSYRRAVGSQKAAIDRHTAELDAKIRQQQALLLEASRQRALLEKLKARKRAAWQKELDRELENEASELYLSRWSRPPES